MWNYSVMSDEYKLCGLLLAECKKYYQAVGLRFFLYVIMCFIINSAAIMY